MGVPGLGRLSRWNDRVALRVAYAIDRMRGYPKLRAKFLERVGYPLDLENPQTFSEKMQIRKLFDRNPVYPILNDKLRARDYVAEKLGAARVGTLYPRIFGVTQTPTADWLRSFGDGVVFKANHGAQMFEVLLPGMAAKTDYDHLAHLCRGWLRRDYGLENQEWGYSPIPRRIFVEEFLTFADGTPAHDLKFTLFDGRLAFVQYNIEQFKNLQNAFGDRDWNLLDIRRKERLIPEFPQKPPGFDEMLAMAEQLGKGFDHIRVDFLMTDQRFVLGELTLYSSSGFTPFTPRAFDRHLGSLWQQKICRA